MNKAFFPSVLFLFILFSCSPKNMDGIKKALTEKDKALLIVNKYLDQLGGVEKLNAIKSIKSSYIMTVMNMDMTVDTYHTADGKFYRRTGTEHRAFHEQKFDGTNAFEKHTGGSEVYSEGPKFEEIKVMSQMFRQRHYADKNYDLKILPDVQEVNGESCVVISITDNSGFEVLEYYGQNSGYLLQESTQMESKTGVPTVVSIIYSDYLPQGVLNFPGNITTTGVGPMGFEMFIKEMKIDQDIDENLFIISK